MNTYKLALSIYEATKDNDFYKTDDTQEQSISVITALIDNIGESATKTLLKTF